MRAGGEPLQGSMAVLIWDKREAKECWDNVSTTWEKFVLEVQIWETNLDQIMQTAEIFQRDYTE